MLTVFDEVEDPMALNNHVVSRAHIKAEVICAVLQNGDAVHFESRQGFNGGEYAKQAFQKFGKCRVIFYQPNDHHMWREVRWKNANVGTLYRRPSFKTLSDADVPDHLQVAAMLL
ncbi:hypothetical protein HOT57_gp39 [Pseudomonas phage phCDa]|uniref:Uncharacterized protein n=1 Tax=Pseudomonas phage phCDa TaxID=2268587 RepID=A0A2Z5H901_9CAUD|nr:hypothetical protein HOT57_gp39 [Pseudomonas phage phCDa]AXC36483.1 hypothetical protein phCDa_39 [Pseudomonas phage phCDa]